jgi:hypothetical protein
VNVSYDFSLPAYRTLTFTDDPTPFARLRGGEASNANPATRHVTKGTSRTRAATTIANARKQPTVHLSSKRGQAARAAPTLMAGPTISPQISLPTRPATATGRMASTSRIGPVPTPRMHARTATSVSLRPPIAVTRTVKLSTKSQTGTTPLAADPEIVLEFEGVDSDVGNDDFMFDV